MEDESEVPTGNDGPIMSRDSGESESLSHVDFEAITTVKLETSNQVRPSSFLHTRTGTIDYENFTADDVRAKDFVPALCAIRRFVGAGRFPWSVGQHTLLCLQVAQARGYSNHHKLSVGLHDAAEAYTGDIPGPLVRYLGAEYRRIEESIEAAIARKFGLGDSSAVFHSAPVKEADWIALHLEGRALFAHYEESKFSVKLPSPIDDTEFSRYDATIKLLSRMLESEVEASLYAAITKMVLD